MKTIPVTTFSDLHNAIQTLPPSVFRGVDDAANALVPRIGRSPYFIAKEGEILTLFKQNARPYLNYEPKDDWEWLALAQHHGVSTRLLDWTYNPLVATYFAVHQNDKETDAAVYALELPERSQLLHSQSGKGPFDVAKVEIFIPNHISSRIAAQTGVFTVHPNPGQPLTDDRITRFLIEAPARLELRRTLRRYGVHAGMLFPDLDGQASFIEGMYQDEEALER